jgi:nucleoside-diphosphate-sugar epimerase
LGTSTNASEKTIALDLSIPHHFCYDLIKSGDFVLLTGGISSPDICSNDETRARKINVDGTIEFINNVIARGGRVVFFSSDVVYGEASSLVDEEAPCNPMEKYASMKHEVEKYFLSEPLFKSIRLSYVFSRDDKFSKYLVNCINDGNTAEIFFPLYRSLIHKSDVIEGVLALVRNWDIFTQRIINFGGPELLSRVDAAQILQQNVLKSLRYKQVTPDESFFFSRPKVIAMSSPILSKLLQRPARKLADAAQIEFSK